MKKALFLLAALIVWGGCQSTGSRPWTDFKKCAANTCVQEALAVKDAFLQQPKTLLAEFASTSEQGEDHVVGWLYLLRDSVLLNPVASSVESRVALQQALVKAAQPFVNDPKLGDIAKSIVGEIEGLAIFEASLTGIYSFDLGDDGNGELQVTQTASNQFSFKLDLVGRGPAHYLGQLEGSATLQPDRTATFTLNEYGGTCTLQFRWSKDANTVTIESGEDTAPPFCGFGDQVMADGTYQRSK